VYVLVLEFEDRRQSPSAIVGDGTAKENQAGKNQAGENRANEKNSGSLQEASAALHQPALITIASVAGQVADDDLFLALACDLVVAADDCVFSIEAGPRNRRALPPAAGTRRLVDLLGYRRAMGLCLAGQELDAAQALRDGLVTRVVSVGDLLSATQTLADQVAGNERTAAIETKALLLAATRRSPGAQAEAERLAFDRAQRDLAGLVAEDPSRATGDCRRAEAH